MKEFAGNPIQIYKLLPKTNCGQCQLPSCLAFAAEVAAGRKAMGDCPELDAQQRNRLQAERGRSAEREFEQAEFFNKLRRKMAAVDFAEVAPLIGARLIGDRLAINSLGRDFWVDAEGKVSSECHIISWVEAPLLSYITNRPHAEVTGRWISFRELKGGIDWQALFTSRCEEPLRRLADEHPGLLEDLIDLFKGKAVEWYQADIALALYPLPKFPILICYQRSDEDLDSALTIFFDECCGLNLHIKAIFTLCSGLVQMFTKIAERHR